jgi:hypothetical protein
MASLKASKLDGARLKGAVFDARTTWPDGFDPTNNKLFAGGFPHISGMARR